MFIIIKQDSEGQVFTAYAIENEKEVGEHITAMAKLTPDYKLIAVINAKER